MILMNSATVKKSGTKYLVLSNIGNCLSPGNRSTITGILLGCLSLIASTSATL